MSSSTSSSRRLFSKILLVLVLGMALCYALLRGFAELNDASAETILARVTEARAALPRILEEERDLVMMFGSSMTRAGFSARLFDRQLEESGVEVRSFNFGIGGLNPYFQDFLSRRIREEFEAKDRRLKLAMIEFVPFQTTSARWNGAQPAVDSFVSMLAKPEELFAMVPKDPTRGLRVLNIHFLRNDISAEMITWYYGEFLASEPERSDLPEDEAAAERRSELGELLNEAFEREYPDYVPSNWNYDWQGAGTIPEERSAETLAVFEEFYDTLRTPRRMENDVLQRAECCDILELHFEELLVEAFIRIVQEFQGFSDHVEVILYPRNTKWIQYSPEAQARLDAVLERIQRETGVTIRNYQEAEEFGPENFSDATHLSRYGGDVPFTAFLADDYLPLLTDLAQ